MRRRHFEAFAPICPVCARAGRGENPLVLAVVRAEDAQGVHAGILHCSEATCRHEYPIVDGMPIIVPALRQLIAERGVELLLRGDLDPVLESLIGDAIGPDSWFDTTRQMLSTYGWDSYADLDPAEGKGDGLPEPGAASSCLKRLLDLAGLQAAFAGRPRLALDLGCGAGRSAFTLAAAAEDALVLGVDTHFALLRLARGAAAGSVSYPRRRLGLVYDRRSFDVALPRRESVDFWACDASALPFAPRIAAITVALNLLDCVPSPRDLLAELSRVTVPGGKVLLATPYDWSMRATAPASWIGGHSQRADHEGAAEASLHHLLGHDVSGLAGGAPHPAVVKGLRLRAEIDQWPWQTRLHDRSTVRYAVHLVALDRVGDV